MSVEIGGIGRTGLRRCARRVRAELRGERRDRRGLLPVRRRREGRRHLGWRRRRQDRRARTPTTRCSSCSPPPRARRRRARTSSRSAASSTSTRRSRSTGPSSRRRARRTSRCAGCSATRRACPRSTPSSPPTRCSRWDPIIHALEVQAPYWEPGTAHGYHAITYGYLVGEVVRRITGKSLGTFWHDEIAEPLDLEFWIGLPAGAGAPRRAARRGWAAGDGSEEATDLTALLGPDASISRALSLNGAFGDLGNGFNSPALHAAEMPAANGITNARSLARFYAALIGGVENGPSDALLSPEQIDAARTCQTEGPDRVLSFPGIELPSTIGLGFWTASAFAPYGGERAFGHSGAGGSVGLRRPRSGHRRRLRDEPDDAGARRRPALAPRSSRPATTPSALPPPSSDAVDSSDWRVAIGSSSTTPASIASTSACACGTGPRLEAVLLALRDAGEHVELVRQDRLAHAAAAVRGVDAERHRLGAERLVGLRAHARRTVALRGDDLRVEHARAQARHADGRARRGPRAASR